MKILKNKILLIVIILSILKIILCAFLPMYYIENFPYDDALMLNNAYSLFDGNYLGDYSNYTLVKGFFFPLLIAFFHLLHIPVAIGFSILYVLACAFFCFKIKDIFQNKKWIYIIYIFLLLNPISFSAETFERLYRNAIGPTQILFLLGFLYSIYKSTSTKKLIIDLIFTGLVLTSIILTREDFIWILPAILIIFIAFILKNKNLKILYLIIPFIITFAILTMTSLINEHYYGIKTNNELNSSNFKKAYVEILKIKPDEEIERVSIPRSTIDKVLKVSKTFQTLEEDINILYEQGGVNYTDEIADGYLFWLLRSLAASNGYYETSDKAEEFWGKVYLEVKTANDRGVLETRNIIPSIFISPPAKSNIIKLFQTLPETFTYVLSYDEVKTFSYEDIENSNIADFYHPNPNSKSYDFYIKYNAVLALDVNNTANFSETSYQGIAGVFNIITFIYKYLSIVINVLGLISFIILLVKKHFKQLLIPITLLVSFITLMCGVTYTHVSAFEAIRYFYLGPAYILLIAFSLINIILLIQKIWYDKAKE